MFFPWIFPLTCNFARDSGVPWHGLCKRPRTHALTIKRGHLGKTRGPHSDPHALPGLTPMKIKSLVIASAFAGVLFSSASAITTTDAPATFEKPAPVKTIQPILVPTSHRSSTVNLTMVIDQAGKPRDIHIADVRDEAAYKSVIDTMAKWEFSPARKNGVAVATRVHLPLELKGL
jgi:hypothetical protein